uniref:PHD-type domain-containing protein n=1 Tax=Graphocephala atropunctata TaxID=36148 RepID=A0A1B6KEG0_9HEMI
MSKNKATPGSKYLCGECSIGVKFSGIYCTGSCKSWYHSGCVVPCGTITDKTLKKFTKEEINSWTCKKCITITTTTLILNTNQTYHEINNQSSGSAPQPNDLYKYEYHDKSIEDSDISNLAEELEKVSSKVEEHGDLDETDLETSLTLAAEAGNFLLKENSNLKSEIKALSKQNSSLEVSLSSMEAKLEEMSIEENKLLNKIEVLHEQFKESLAQLDKEKQNRAGLQQLFEENDKTQSLALQMQENKIIELENIIQKLKKDNRLMAQNSLDIESKTDQNLWTKILCHIGTQTADNELSVVNHKSFILTELAQMKTRQDQMEEAVLQL